VHEAQLNGRGRQIAEMRHRPPVSNGAGGGTLPSEAPALSPRLSRRCTEWDGKELISKLNLDWPSLPSELRINGEHWFLEELEWAQRKMDETGSDDAKTGPDNAD